jgi:hypothetical protein
MSEQCRVLRGLLDSLLYCLFRFVSFCSAFFRTVLFFVLCVFWFSHPPLTFNFISSIIFFYISTPLTVFSVFKFLESGLGCGYIVEPRSGILSPWGVTVVTVRVRSRFLDIFHVFDIFRSLYYACFPFLSVNIFMSKSC